MKAVVLVGGFGTRLRPLTLTTPKQMLPVVGTTMLEHVIGGLGAHGVDEVVLSLGYKEDVFREAYPDGECAGVALTYAVEPEPRPEQEHALPRPGIVADHSVARRVASKTKRLAAAPLPDGRVPPERPKHAADGGKAAHRGDVAELRDVQPQLKRQRRGGRVVAIGGALREPLGELVAVRRVVEREPRPRDP